MAVESLKQRVIQLAVVRQHIGAVVRLRQATNGRLRDSLQLELLALADSPTPRTSRDASPR